MSDETTSNLPICVYCGTPRPADESNCPNCGKPWIDVSVPDAAAPPPPPPAATRPGGVPVPPPPHGVDDTGEFDFDDWTLPPEQPRSRARWIIPILLLIAVIVVWGLVFVDRGSPSTTTVAAETTTTQSPVTTIAETTTTVPETTTTVPETTTTTTTIPYPLPEDWAPAEDGVGLDELSLKAAGVGPLEFGAPLAYVAGQLTGAAGQAQEAGVEGTCGPEEGYWLQFGALRALFDGWESGSVFVSYRYEEVAAGPDLGLTTLSGLALGDTVADLKAIYGSSYTITFELIDGKDHFRLSDGGELLLWGPVSSSEDDGMIEGIFSPTPCDI